MKYSHLLAFPYEYVHSTTHQMSSHRAGNILVMVSAIVFSSVGVFTKAVGSGAWKIIFWRGVFAAGFTTAYIMWPGKLRQEFVQMGGRGWVVAVVGAPGTAAFIPAFKLTTMANVMLIYAAAPLIAALLAWFWIKERMNARAMLRCLGAIVGVVRARHIITCTFQASSRPSSKARGGRMTSHSTDEQRRGAG